MFQKILGMSLIIFCSHLWAAKIVDLYQAPVSRLKQISSLMPTTLSSSSILNTQDLKLIRQTRHKQDSINRYQQVYHGIPIIGAQVTISHHYSAIRGLSNGQVNGRIFDEIQLNTNATIHSQEAIERAKQAYFKSHGNLKTSSETTALQIRSNKDQELKLVYLVSFKSVFNDNQAAWPFFVIDANTGEIIKQWNNIQHYSDTGPGGNEKTHEYWYGKDGLPNLEVSQRDQYCVLDDEKVSVVNLHSAWDWDNLNRIPFQYNCGNNSEDLIHGSYSVDDDAYYFGHIIVDLYKNWYGVNALEDSKGNAQKLIMRVHFGEAFDNAFWDGETMSFGDGYYLYPLVSLDVAAHEVSHGFTQQHANLEYHDEPGAINESFSDMAGQAAKAYLLETKPELYNKAHITANEVTWKIGETLFPATLPIDAIRFMDLPSLDNSSADCVDKKMARSYKSICAISYPELLAKAKLDYPAEEEQQSFIVHTASGVFNRAFYLLSNQFGIKTAFHMMTLANIKYWTPNIGFDEAACGVLHAAKDLNLNTDIVQTSFRKVGIDLSSCQTSNTLS